MGRDGSESRDLRAPFPGSPPPSPSAGPFWDGRLGSGGPAADQRPLSGPSFDVAAVMRKVHFAFRRRDGGWRGGHVTYEAALQPDGLLEVTPYHHPAGRGTGSPSSREVAPSRAERRASARAEAIAGTAVTFAPSSVARGTEVVASGPSEATTNGEGQLETSRGIVTERIANGPDGVEQSWRLAGRPDGDGDLEVRIAVAAGDFAGETEGGLHFRAGALGVRYGHATWIDGLGARVPVPARWDGRAIVLRVPEAVVEGSVYPALLDPVIGPEKAIDEPVTGPAGAEQSFPAVASDGTDYLVVWQDKRIGTGFDIYGARVTGADARVLDPLGIPISTAANEQSSPAVAWDGARYFVVWQDFRTGISFDIYGARVSPEDGRVEDGAGIAVSTYSSDQVAPAVVWDGTNHLVVWEDERSGVDVFGARVQADGTVLDPTGFPISQATGNQAGPEVAWDGANYLVVWTDLRANGVYGDIYGTRVSPARTILNPSGIAISTALNHQSTPALAWDGSRYLVVWYDTRNAAAASGDDLYGARVTAAGAVLDTGGIPISRAPAGQGEPVVAWDGTNFLAVWQDARNGKTDVFGARVSGSSGTVLDPAGIAIATANLDPNYPYGQFAPAVASNGSGSLVVWHDLRSRTAYDVYGARIGADGTVGDPNGVLVSTGPNEERAPVIAWGGSNAFIAWEDTRAGSGADIYGARVSGSDGSLLDASGIAITSEAYNQSAPSVAWDGANYFVVWTDQRNVPLSKLTDVYGARVTGADGILLDESGIAIASAAQDQKNPSVAWTGTDFLVVWDDRRGGTWTDIYGARIDGGSGSVLDPTGFAISGSSYNQLNPAVACNGDTCLVAWEDDRANYMIHTDLYGARVRGTSVLEAGGIPISTGAEDEKYPAVAWGGTNYLVVWADYRGLGTADVFGARVRGSDGVLLDATGIAISRAANSQDAPAVAWDGGTFLVAWQDFRSGTSRDIYGARVSATGTLGDPSGFLVSGSSGAEQSPAIASPGPRRFMVVYAGFDSSPLVGVYRVFSRSVLLDTPPTADAQAVTTNEDTSVPIVLTGADADGDPLTFRVEMPPAHGALSGSGATLTYVPEPDFHGADAFAFVVDDGLVSSVPATVTVDVASVNDGGPIAEAQSVSTDEDAPVGIDLVATEPDGDPLTWTLVTLPAHGTLAGSGSTRTYSPAPDYSGPDSFSFVASDGSLQSQPATVTIVVTPVNDPPSAAPQSLATSEDLALDLVLGGADPEGDALDATVVSAPLHGALLGTGTNLTYVPDGDYHGADSFSFVVNDGLVDSAPATVLLAIEPMNDPPVANAGAWTVAEDASAEVTLVGSDVDGDSVEYLVVTQPAHGALSGSAGTWTYSPAPDFSGTDAFTFMVHDGAEASGEATVTITVTPVNDAPAAHASAISVEEDGSVVVAVSGSDSDGDALGYAIVAPPTHGSLTGAGPGFTYAPAPGFNGTDAFTFVANDGTVDSAPATVTITVTPVDERAEGGCSCGTTEEAAPLALFAVVALARRRRMPQRPVQE